MDYEDCDNEYFWSNHNCVMWNTCPRRRERASGQESSCCKNLETTLLPPKIASALNCKKMKAPTYFSRRNGQVLFIEMCICNNLGLSGIYI